MSRIAGVVAILAMAFSAVQGLRPGVESFRESFVLVSSRPPLDDQALVDFANSNYRFAYARQDSAFGAALLRTYLPGRQHPDLVLVGEGAKHEVVTDPRVIQQRIEALTAVGQSHARLPFLYAALAGFAIGLIGTVRLRWALGYLLAGSAFAASWKWSHQCPTCPHATIAGLDAGAFGTLAYAGVLLAVATGRATGEALALAVCGLAATWQSVAILGNSELCVPCAVIYGANFAVIGLLLSAAPREAPVNRRLGAVVAMGLGLATLCAAAMLHGRQVGKAPAAAQTHPVDRNVWIGKPASALGIGHTKAEHGEFLVFLRDGCEACEDAWRALTPHVELPLRFFTIATKGEMRVRGELVQPDLDKFPAAPMMFAVNPAGTIVGEYRGWANDARWAQIFVQKVLSDIASPEVPPK